MSDFRIILLGVIDLFQVFQMILQKDYLGFADFINGNNKQKLILLLHSSEKSGCTFFECHLKQNKK
jgi:hypothetical protein